MVLILYPGRKTCHKNKNRLVEISQYRSVTGNAWLFIGNYVWVWVKLYLSFHLGTLTIAKYFFVNPAISADQCFRYLSHIYAGCVTFYFRNMQISLVFNIVMVTSIIHWSSKALSNYYWQVKQEIRGENLYDATEHLFYSTTTTWSTRVHSHLLKYIISSIWFGFSPILFTLFVPFNFLRIRSF